MPKSQESDGVLPALPIALGTFTVLLWSLPALALDPSLDVSQYAHTTWTFRNGFLNGAVYAIAQTPDGYLWLGTQSGVVRLDGVRTAPLVLPPGQELPSTVVGGSLSRARRNPLDRRHYRLASWEDGKLAHERIV